MWRSTAVRPEQVQRCDGGAGARWVHIRVQRRVDDDAVRFPEPPGSGFEEFVDHSINARLMLGAVVVIVTDTHLENSIPVHTGRSVLI